MLKIGSNRIGSKSYWISINFGAVSNFNKRDHEIYSVKDINQLAESKDQLNGRFG